MTVTTYVNALVTVTKFPRRWKGAWHLSLNDCASIFAPSRLCVRICMLKFMVSFQAGKSIGTGEKGSDAANYVDEFSGVLANPRLKRKP